jgi:hypothetical protein
LREGFLVDPVSIKSKEGTKEEEHDDRICDGIHRFCAHHLSNPSSFFYKAAKKRENKSVISRPKPEKPV